MNRHDVATIILGLGLVSTSWGALRLEKEIHQLRKDVTTSMGLLRGNLDRYKAKNLKVWEKQQHFNEDVVAEFKKFNILRSQRFTIESKDD